MLKHFETRHITHICRYNAWPVECPCERESLRRQKRETFVPDECDKMLGQLVAIVLSSLPPSLSTPRLITMSSIRHAPRCSGSVPNDTSSQTSHDVQRNVGAGDQIRVP
jgi:hypothetical protein